MTINRDSCDVMIKITLHCFNLKLKHTVKSRSSTEQKQVS